MPDQIDPQKLRQAREWATSVNPHINDPCHAAAELILSLPEPEPLTMDKIEWSDAVHHLAEAEWRRGTSLENEKLIMLGPAMFADGAEWITCQRADGKHTTVRMAEELTPTGRRFKLVPAGWEGINGPFPDRQPETTEPVEEPVVRPFATGGMLRTLDKLNTRAEQGSNSLGKLKSSEPQPGEAWLVAYSHVPNETFNVIFDHGGHSYDSQGSVWGLDEVTPLHRLSPAVEPKVLATVEDYLDAPIGTVILWGHTVAEKKGPDSWFTTNGMYNERSRVLSELYSATVIHTPGGQA